MSSTVTTDKHKICFRINSGKRFFSLALYTIMLIFDRAKLKLHSYFRLESVSRSQSVLQKRNLFDWEKDYCLTSNYRALKKIFRFNILTKGNLTFI